MLELKRFNSHFVLKKSDYFLTRVQKPDESTDEFNRNLKNLSILCKLGQLTDSLVKSMFTLVGLSNQEEEKKLYNFR